MSVRTKKNSCPHCGYGIDAATAAKNKDIIPAEGDYSVCFHCSGFLIFNKDLTVSKLDGSIYDTDLTPDLRDTLIRIKYNIQERNFER